MVKIAEQPKKTTISGARLMTGNLPFFLFLGFLAILYIANAHRSERKIRNIQAFQKEMREIKGIYLSLQSEIMVQSKLSELSKRVESLGLVTTGEPPKIVNVK
jgi:hypothetical protein